MVAHLNFSADSSPSRSTTPQSFCTPQSPCRDGMSPRLRVRTTPPRSVLQGDRFISNRGAMDWDVAHFNLFNENESPSNKTEAHLEVASPSKEAYKKQLAQRLLGEDGSYSPKILALKDKSLLSPKARDIALNNVYPPPNAETARSPRKHFRQIPQSPERILDAPELIDDYYLNLLDWSSRNVVAVALGPSVYLWNANSGEVKQLMQTSDAASDDYVTSISWACDGKHLSIGTNTAEIQLWDVEAQRQVRTLRGHGARVSCIAWNGCTLASGSRDNTIMQHDVRSREHVTATLFGQHSQEVCGLKWSPSGQQLASGGNDNLLHIWDAQSISHRTHVHRLEHHQAAVKALAWCPFQSSLLASGGGTADRCIKFWNTTTGALVNSVDTHSQVCSLQWSKHEREILSSHGYSRNQLCLWKYPNMLKMAELNGHTSRVLHMAQSPDGYSVVSAAADETLRFWKPFGQPEPSAAKNRVSGSARSVLKSINIR
ncbi:ubiquitin-protein transferase activating protein [Cymbomonas tetramitiformis]|uniref:Ubiquitin-protein transferase activating protein n=1 Tax=Cymbomonas tetramitiformis TaxID=36881 RepID=A0AAE0BGH3_9CHLO|nr:ubiquitin-protein transferase activating protein [Cymbomonas tetramitiformis]